MSTGPTSAAATPTATTAATAATATTTTATPPNPAVGAAPSGPVAASQNIYTEAVLWYNVGIFGELGYGIPNPGDNIGTLNPNIADISRLIGRALFLLMHHEDADINRPPSINTLTRIHQLYVRAGNILTGRAVPPSELGPEVEHATPAGDIFTVYPCPFFKVRNVYMRRWAGWIMTCLTECFQNQENRKTVNISTDFAADVGKWLSMAYVNMAIEMFNKPRATAMAPGFLLTAADLAAYNPGAFFTSQEMIDTVPSFDNVMTTARVAQLAGGILITQLPTLMPYPGNLLAITDQIRNAQQSTINPDTGQLGTTADRTSPAPVFPAGSSFIG